MTKRIITLLLALAMVFSLGALAGCEDSGDKPADGNTNTNAQFDQAEEEFFLDMPAELRGTTVYFATWIDHTKTDTAAVLAGFAETTGMNIQLTQVNQTDYAMKMIGLIGAGQSPDVAVENGDFPKSLNLLQPLEIETTGLDVKDSFWDQNIVEYFSVGGKYYLVQGANSTWKMGGAVTYFNKTILEENGITTPYELVEQDNWNLDTFYQLLKDVKNSCRLTRPGGSIAFDVWNNLYAGSSQIAWDTTTDKFVNNIKDEKVVKAIQTLIKYKDEGLVKIVDHHDPFLTDGSHVIQIAGAYGLRKHPGWFYQMDLDDLAFTVPPKANSTDADYPYSNSIRGYGICKGAKNPKGAAYFLRYFLNGNNYDYNQIFKNDTARDLYLQIREKADFSKIAGTTRGVALLTDANYNELSLVGELIGGTVSQVSVNLTATSNKIDDVVDTANQFIENFKTTQ